MSNENNGRFEFNVDLSGIDFPNIALFVLGAAGAVGSFMFLQTLSVAVASAMPFLLGGTLFAAIVGSFFYMLKMLKTMRVRASFRLSFWEGYTALAVFTVMGYFATACMQVFVLHGGNALTLWTNGAIACGAFASFFGVGRFVTGLWNENAK